MYLLLSERLNDPWYLYVQGRLVMVLLPIACLKVSDISCLVLYPGLEI